MPDYTEKLNLPKPLGNENVTRENYRALIDAIDNAVAKAAHTHDGTTGNGAQITAAGLANGAATDTVLGNRTADPAQTPSGSVGTITQLFSWITNRIKAMLGTTNWYDAPPTTLTAANTHMTATTGVHGATSAATANTLITRDGNGRAQVAVPSAAADIARKDTVDAVATVANAALPATSYTAADVLTKIKTVDGAGSGLDADLVKGYVPLNKAGDTMTGGLTISNGAPIITLTETDQSNKNWHIVTDGGNFSIRETDLATERFAISAGGDWIYKSNILPQLRATSGYLEWYNGGAWQPVGGQTAIQATYTRTATLNANNKAPRTWHSVVDIQNKRGIIMHAVAAVGVNAYINSGDDYYVVGSTLYIRLTIDDQVETMPMVIPNNANAGQSPNLYPLGALFIRDEHNAGGDYTYLVQLRQDPIYFMKNFKLELYGDPTQAGYTNSAINVSGTVRYALHIGT
ncbi:hypothetical protein GC096_30695 [Paenibacillus sp. LMG 31461]|uniref:Uncharacterized protein n=1 Tax=Paenibacillus plantarum TaxID=2654975 RepID=A0ABX1XJ19_9BACL|nr:hypothetical protein [Paenibacillus plantarum]NOU68399.1 hypothetical protein [Paenibacillus plantarum]